MQKIPVKIVELIAPGGKKSIEVMIDVYDYHGIEDPKEKIKQFKKMYFELVKKAQDILPKNESKRKSSHFWTIGKLLYDFNKSIENEFEITNFNQAIVRDFGLYKRSHVGYILKLGEFFTKKDISDIVPLVHYQELINKTPLIGKLAFQKEKNRLLERANNKTLSDHKEYREELNALVKSKNLGG